MDNKEYTFEFDKSICCWKNVCGLRNTNRCCAACPRYTKMHYLLGNSLLPKAWWLPKDFYTSEDNIDYEAHLRCFEIKNNIVDFVKKGKQLVIYGKSSGSGKTHISARLILAYFGKIWELTAFRPRALFIQLEKLFNEQKKSFTKESPYKDFIMANYEDVDLIIWDDIGLNEELNQQQYDLLFTIINDRELSGKANVFTTNKSKEELLNYLGERLYSRIVRSAEWIEFKGSDNRRADL
jgi:DNA replication protein DnaC